MEKIIKTKIKNGKINNINVLLLKNNKFIHSIDNYYYIIIIDNLIIDTKRKEEKYL